MRAWSNAGLMGKREREREYVCVTEMGDVLGVKSIGSWLTIVSKKELKLKEQRCLS